MLRINRLEEHARTCESRRITSPITDRITRRLLSVVMREPIENLIGDGHIVNVIGNGQEVDHELSFNWRASVTVDKYICKQGPAENAGPVSHNLFP